MNKSNRIVIVISLLIGLSVGFWLSPKEIVGVKETSEAVPSKPLFYRNPMNPEITSPTPAKDSMGMDYIPVYADQHQPDQEPSGTVKIDPVVVQNMGVRTVIAKQQSLSREIRAVARVDFAEDRVTRLHPKVEGWIKEIYIDKTGEQIKDDDILLAIYSPKLVSTQQEYLLALNNLKALQQSRVHDIKVGAEALVKSARERLHLLDVPEHQIRELEQSREIKQQLHIHSPAAGTVVAIGAREGQYVTPQTELYRIVDLSQVWVYADIYDYELPWVQVGDAVELSLASVPGQKFIGTVAYIYPYAEAKTRTTKVRLVFDNPKRLLRPDIFAQVSIDSDLQQDVIVIPSESVVRTGGKTQVFVAKGEGKFEPRKVNLGLESEGQVAVLEGLEVDEVVVTSAQFLLDSESKLKEATAKMLEAQSQDSSESKTKAKQPMAPQPHHHGGH